ncbi:tubulin-specific chaperone C [Betta splendens]|uniref:Tubulin-specific chaperone C n=1 Tax=Betta splendens TaxID=158456 RepID=A0A6P7LA03_BETSP|nr:tubulin-specific chaperone C [Betta splendens]
MEATAEVQQENGFHDETGSAKMHERLQKRHQARVEDAERRKEAKDSQSVAEEKGEYFSSAFNRERLSIEELLSSCPGAERAAVAQRLEEATARTGQLQKFLNDSVLFLTQYELRQAQQALQKLQASLAEAREEALPKKKFAFRTRTKAADKAAAPAPGLVPDLVSSDAGEHAGSVQVDGAAVSEQCGFSNMHGQVLTKTSDEIQKRDVLLTHLTHCKVRLLGSPSTLHLKHIDGCEILCGPVSSSVFVDHCRDSTLAFPCQQLRTHNTTDTQVYLHVTSRAIIEDCHGVGLAPFSWSYPQLEEDFTVSGLDRDRNNWSQVDDFNWLAAGTASPNWSVIPEVDRKTSWDP